MEKLETIFIASMVSCQKIIWNVGGTLFWLVKNSDHMKLVIKMSW